MAGYYIPLVATPQIGDSGGGGGGGSSNMLVVNLVSENGTTRLDKTWQEIYDTLDNGGTLFFVEKKDGVFFTYPLSSLEGGQSYYAVYLWIYTRSMEWEFGTNSANGYPASSN